MSRITDITEKPSMDIFYSHLQSAVPPFWLRLRPSGSIQCLRLVAHVEIYSATPLYAPPEQELPRSKTSDFGFFRFSLFKMFLELGDFCERVKNCEKIELQVFEF